jgi:phage tail-like protein
MKRASLLILAFVGSAVLVSTGFVRDTRLSGQTNDSELSSLAPSGPFVFRLELSGDQVADYNECFGLGSSNEIEEVVAPAGEGVKEKTPGALEWNNITLKRIGPSGAGVWSWRKAMEDGDLKGAIRDGTIIMYREGSNVPLANWDFRDGWAARLTIEGSVEELTIVHEGLQRTDITGHPAESGGRHTR